METPTDAQIAEAIILSKRAGETEAELYERIENMCRLTDEDLAAMGIYPLCPEPVEGPVKGACPERVEGQR